MQGLMLCTELSITCSSVLTRCQSLQQQSSRLLYIPCAFKGFFFLMTFTNPWGAAFKYALLKSQCFNGLLHQMNLSFLIGLQSTGPITHIGQSSQLRNRLCPDLPSILNRGLSIHNIIKSSNRSNTDPGKLPNGESFSKQLPHCWRSVCPLVRGLWCIVWRRLLFTFAGERRHKKNNVGAVAV